MNRVLILYIYLLYAILREYVIKYLPSLYIGNTVSYASSLLLAISFMNETFYFQCSIIFHQEKYIQTAHSNQLSRFFFFFFFNKLRYFKSKECSFYNLQFFDALRKLDCKLKYCYIFFEYNFLFTFFAFGITKMFSHILRQ